MYRTIVIAAVLAVLAGCDSGQKNEAKLKVYQRWSSARADVLCLIACEHLKAGQLKEASQKANEALDLDRDNVEARVLLGKIRIEQGQYAQALEQFARARELMDAADKRRKEQQGEGPKETAVADKAATQSAELAYLQGVALEKTSRLDEALASYQQALELQPDNTDFIRTISEVLVMLNRLDEAKAFVGTHLDHADSQPGLYEVGGRIAVMQGRWADAAGFFEQAHDLDSRNVRYRELLGWSYYKAGRHAEAVDMLDGLHKCPGYKVPAWAEIMLGDSCLAINRNYDARDAYERASALDSKSAGIWVKLAQANLAVQDNSRAMQAGQQALAIQADNVQAMGMLGWALVGAGRSDQAVKVLTRAVDLAGSDPQMHILLGRAYETGGNELEAVRCYTRALRLDPANPAARQLLKGRELSELSSLK